MWVSSLSDIKNSKDVKLFGGYRLEHKSHKAKYEGGKPTRCSSKRGSGVNDFAPSLRVLE
jgi:hypothetical protein